MSSMQCLRILRQTADPTPCLPTQVVFLLADLALSRRILRDINRTSQSIDFRLERRASSLHAAGVYLAGALHHLIVCFFGLFGIA